MLVFNMIPNLKMILCVPQHADRGVDTYSWHSLHSTNHTCSSKQWLLVNDRQLLFFSFDLMSDLSVCILYYYYNKMLFMVMFAHEPSGSSGRSLSQFPQHEATRSISTPPGWDASPLQVTPSIKFAGTHLYNWVERDNVRVKCLAQGHNTMSPARAQNLSHSIRSWLHSPWDHCASYYYNGMLFIKTSY